MAPEGHQSPPPERQTGSQLHEAPGSGTTNSKEQATKDWSEHSGKTGTEGLTSNPKGVMDDELKQKFAKTQ